MTTQKSTGQVGISANLNDLTDKELEEVGTWVANKANDYLWAQYKVRSPFAMYAHIVSFFTERKFPKK